VRVTWRFYPIAIVTESVITLTGFVEWLVARHYRMILMAAALALLPPLGVVGQAVVVLAVLTQGLATGIFVAAVATALMTVPAFISGTQPAALLVLALVNWLPALGLAAVLERTRSLSLTVQVATVVMMAATIVYFMTGSPVDTWHGVLNEYIAAMGDRIPEVPAGFVPAVSRIMTGLLAAMTVLSSMLAVFIGRWWQSRLSNPGAFGSEFRGLRMGTVMGLVAGLVFIAAALTKITLLENLTLVLMTGFLLHGLAVTHTIAAAGIGSLFLPAIYVLIVVGMPYAEVALAGLGFVDNWFDLRSRVTRR